MDAIAQLWIPVLATAVLVFVASSLIHMVFKWHSSDYRQLANEDEVRAAVRAASPTPGQYVIPYCADMKEMGNEAMLKKFTEGPIAIVTVRKNGMPSMGTPLLLWFLLNLVLAAIAAVLAMQAYPGKANAHAAGCLAGVVTFLAYGGGSVQLAIWMGKRWGSVAKDMVDCAVFAVITALVFTWLWP